MILEFDLPDDESTTYQWWHTIFAGDHQLRFLHKDLMKVTNTFVNVMEHRKEVFYLGSVLVFLFSVLFVLLGQFSSFVGVVKS